MNLNKYKVKESYGNIETNEILLDAMAHTKEEELGISEKRLEVKIKEKIIYAMFGLFFLISFGLFAKTFYFQAVEGKELYAAGEGNKAQISLVTPQRGIIYDKNFKKLVSNSPAFDLVCDKRNYHKDPESYATELQALSEVSGTPYEELKTMVEQSQNSKILILENMTHEKLLVAEARIHELPDCQVEKNTIRNYAMGPIFSHVLGYLGKIGKEELRSAENYTPTDYIGKNGLEKAYESYLRGTPGMLEVIRTASGIERGDTMIAEPREGYNVVLNIDADLQKKTYEALEKSIKNIGSSKGAAVALDPRNGAVLAMVSYPAYDNNIFSARISQEDYNALQSNPNQPFFNRAIAAQYPTGSTIKPFMAAGALQEKIISPTKQLYDPGFIEIHNQYDPSITYRFGGVEPHGWVDMREALAVSSNIYFYTVGGGYEGQQGLGPTRIKKYLDLFGWEQKTGVDLPGEFAGFVPSPDWKKEYKNENWWDGDTYNLSIGQSDLKVTPLHVAVAYAAIANGGTLYKPQIAQKVVSATDSEQVIAEFQPEIMSQNFIDPENLEIVRQGMRDGVLYGSSVMLNSLPVDVAGKTGTAETGRDGYFNTWSSNFAPYDNPEIVFVVTIEGVNGLRAATLPVANEVLYWYFTHR